MFRIHRFNQSKAIFDAIHSGVRGFDVVQNTVDIQPGDMIVYRSVGPDGKFVLESQERFADPVECTRFIRWVAAGGAVPGVEAGWAVLQLEPSELDPS